ncbi:MAG: hypothetical protein JWP89_1996 [Schlesneria sp.]|nr:hypothetical protein [Schlesneria sp.]
MAVSLTGATATPKTVWPWHPDADNYFVIARTLMFRNDTKFP